MKNNRISSLIVEAMFELMYSSGGFPVDKLAELDQLIKTHGSHSALQDLKRAEWYSYDNDRPLIDRVVSYLATLSYKYNVNLQTMC